jgi:DNA-binding IclR family transcriptional regulator
MKERKVKARPDGEPGERQAVRSVVVGASLLTALARHSGAATLSSLAASAGMAPAKAHRYLAGYIEAGFAAQDPRSGRYLLGPLALEIGLAAVRRLDILEAAQDALLALRDEVKETISLTVWGNLGPTVVRWLEGPQPVSLATHLGVVLPISRSANGRVFLAFLDSKITEPLVDAELRREGVSASEREHRMAELRRSSAQVHASGLAVSDNLVQPGISSLAAPIFAYPGTVVASVAVVGVHDVLDITLDGKPAATLRTAADRISARLGASSSTRS